ncbi:hypothetical protein OPQ81_002413 [Rhizoctonia solani]|nr:hypothetical protein OPQ81_002413 [Rhizoctonia solani]
MFCVDGAKKGQPHPAPTWTCRDMSGRRPVWVTGKRRSEIFQKSLSRKDPDARPRGPNKVNSYKYWGAVLLRAF